MIAEMRSTSSHFVQVRRLNDTIAHVTKRVPAKIIGHDDNDVRCRQRSRDNQEVQAGDEQGFHFFCQRCHSRPGRSTRNCTIRHSFASVTYAVRPSAPPKQMFVGCGPSTSISVRTTPCGEIFATVPLPWRVT